MDITYTEIKDDAQYTYLTLRKERAQSLHNIFYAFLEDYICSIHVTHNFTEKASVYISFTRILIDNNEDYSFLKDELDEVIKLIDKEKIKDEIGEEEFCGFEKDLNTILRKNKNTNKND